MPVPGVYLLPRQILDLQESFLMYVSKASSLELAPASGWLSEDVKPSQRGQSTDAELGPTFYPTRLSFTLGS